MTSNIATTSQARHELEEAVERLVGGARDPRELAQACADMDRRREETLRQFGLLDIGVPAIRELRGELPEQ